MARKPQVAVEQRAGGRWAIQTDGTSRADSLHDRQSDAVRCARELAKNKETEIVIKGEDGGIRQKDSQGNDPRGQGQRGLSAPSTISKRIAQLESDLGVELLTRGRHGVPPTPAGLALLDQRATSCLSIDRIVDDTAAFSGTAGVQGNLRLIASASALAELLLDDVASSCASRPNRRIRIDIEDRFSRDLVRQSKERGARADARRRVRRPAAFDRGARDAAARGGQRRTREGGA